MITSIVMILLLLKGGFTFAQTALITGQKVNVRTGPGTTYAVMATIFQEEQYPIIAKTVDWYKIRLEDGREGWVYGKLVIELRQEPVPTESLQPSPPSTPVEAPKSINLSTTITGKDGAEMVLIPAGEFIMGSNVEEVERILRTVQGMRREWMIDEIPAHRVYLDAFYIDKYEVSNALYEQFMQATGRKQPEYWTYVQFNKKDQPVVGVTWYDAKAYCEWAGKRLPTEAEWEKAARGTDRRMYPWGNTWEGNRANTLHSGPGHPAPVNAYEAGQSPYGVYNLSGNVWEWVADWFEENYYQNSPARNPRGPGDSIKKVIRGGSWFTIFPVNTRTANRGSFSPEFWRGSVGFRCAQDAP